MARNVTMVWRRAAKPISVAAGTTNVRHPSLPTIRRNGQVALLASLALACVAACDRASERPPNAAVSTVATPVAPLSAPKAAEGAHMGDTSNPNAPPMKAMTKEEESASMPQPGQANDHSTTAKDKK